MFQIVGMLKVDANPCQGYLQEVARAIVRGNLYLDSLYKELLPATPDTSQLKTHYNVSKNHDREETESTVSGFYTILSNVKSSVLPCRREWTHLSRTYNALGVSRRHFTKHGVTEDEKTGALAPGTLLTSARFT